MKTSDDSALGLSGQGNQQSPSLKSAIPTVQSASIGQGAVSPSIISDPNAQSFDAHIPDELKSWFPMRIAHGRPERALGIREFLTQHQVVNFLPMTYKMRVIKGKPKRVLLPAIDNLIFIRSVEECITFMKRTQSVLLPLRYIMWHPIGSEFSSILRIPDRQMQNFMRVASVQDDRVMYLGNKDFSQKIGRKVRVLDGPFKGVVGTVYRVKKDRRVVVSLDNITSLAISYIDPSLLQELEDKVYRNPSLSSLTSYLPIDKLQ